MDTRKRKSKKGDARHLIAAAYLRSQGENQTAIAQRLKISQTLVSHLIVDAKRKGILEETIRFAKERISSEELALLEADQSTGPLQRRLSQIGALAPEGRVPSLHVYPCRSRNTTAVAWQHRIERFSADCAEDLLKVLHSASIIGVAWGVMIASAVDAMQKTQTSAAKSKHTVIPLLGEPLGRPSTQHSSSVLASKLAEILGSDPDSGLPETLSLAPVPAFIPADMKKAETSAIWKFIRRITAYRKIFGAGDEVQSDGERKPSPLIEQVGAILTSVSTQERPLGFDDDGLIRAADIRKERLNELVIGDLCGVVIRRPNLDKQARTEIKRIMAQWTGVRLDHLAACANRAQKGSDSGDPGIIALAIGANKATVVHEALRRGLIQHLFMDEDLAGRLGEICAMSSRNS